MLYSIGQNALSWVLVNTLHTLLYRVTGPGQEGKQRTNYIMYRHWKRICKIKSDRWNSYVFQWAYKSALNANCRDWIYKVRKYFADIGMGRVCICSNELDYNYIYNDVKVVIHDFYFNEWCTT